MPNPIAAYPHETLPVGKSKQEQQRNAELLDGYDYGKYPQALTGFTGQDLQRIGFVRWEPAIRTRVGLRGNYKSGFTRLSDGTLVLAVCRDNNDPEVANRRFFIYAYESCDQGLTWREIGQTTLTGKEPSLAAFGDRSLVLFAQGGCYGPGANTHTQTVARSQDGGRTWDVSTYQCNDYPRNIIVESDGALLFATAVKPDWENKGDGKTNLLMHRSCDGGKTWSTSEGTVDWDYPAFGEVGAIRLKDGRLLAALRRQIPQTLGEGFGDTVITESTDNGKAWSRPRQLLSAAKVHAYLTELHDGRILCTYSNYHVPFGVSAIISADGGKTWDWDNTIRLATSNGFWVGWAVTLQLPDRSLITSYATTSYREQLPDRFTAEVVRWRIPS